MTRLDWKRRTEITHETVIKNWAPWGPEDVRFLALAMAGEVGELLNLIKKQWRGDLATATSDQASSHYMKVRGEMADVRIYLELLSRALGVDLDAACEDKVEQLMIRWPKCAERIRAEEEKA